MNLLLTKLLNQWLLSQKKSKKYTFIYLLISDIKQLIDSEAHDLYTLRMICDQLNRSFEEVQEIAKKNKLFCQYVALFCSDHLYLKSANLENKLGMIESGKYMTENNNDAQLFNKLIAQS